MKKRILSVLLSVAFFTGICMIPFSVSAISMDGECFCEYTEVSETISPDTSISNTDSDISVLASDNAQVQDFVQTYNGPSDNSTGTTTTIYPEMTYGQTDARSMLASINSFRTGSNAWYWNQDNTTKVWINNLSPLTYDYGLEKDAMQRAAEIAVIFSHTRPNGQSCWTAYTNDDGCAGENIAAGYSSVNSAFVAWCEENEDFSGQGHRRNMLSSYAKYVGIGHVYYNGYHYWVQEFSSEPTNLNSTAANNSLTTTTVQILVSNITNTQVSWAETSGTKTIAAGSSLTVAAPFAKYTITGHWPSGTVNAYVSSTGYTISSSAPSIASVSGNIVTGVSAGSATISCKMGGTIVGSCTVTVTGDFKITSQPQNATTSMGSNAVFSVTATGAASYQWYYSADSKTWKKVTAADMKGATTSTLTVPVTTAYRMGLKFRCEVKGASGTTITSNTAGITDNFAITSQPQNAAVSMGSNAVFSVTATGAASYQWYYSTDNKTWKKVTAADMKGATTSTLTVPVTTAYRAGLKFRCEVKGASGNTLTSNSAGITLNLTIASQPVNASVKMNENAVFSVTATGAASYQWYYSADGQTWKKVTAVDMKGSTTSTLTVPVTTAYRAGLKFRCVVKGATGTAITSNSASITLSLAITSQPQNVTTSMGGNAVFSVTATGATSYQWYYSADGQTWKKVTAADMRGATTSTLTVPVITSYRAGLKFRCEVKGTSGTTLTSDAAGITLSLSITSQPQNVTVSMGNNAVFSVTATGATSYQWYYSADGQSWKKVTAADMKGVTTSTLTVPVTTAYRAGLEFRCEVKGSAGTTITSNSAGITLGLSITSQPANANVKMGGNAVFSVTATGAASYQWYYSADGQTWKKVTAADMKGATTSTLTVPVTTAYRAGLMFRCEVTGTAGDTITSNSAGINAQTYNESSSEAPESVSQGGELTGSEDQISEETTGEDDDSDTVDQTEEADEEDTEDSEETIIEEAEELTEIDADDDSEITDQPEEIDEKDTESPEEIIIEESENLPEIDTDDDSEIVDQIEVSKDEVEALEETISEDSENSAEVAEDVAEDIGNTDNLEA